MSEPSIRVPIPRVMEPERGFLRNDVPPEFADHPLLARMAFYTLPQEFLQLLRVEKVTVSFDEEALRMELALTDRIGAAGVGYVAGVPTIYTYLTPSLPIQVTPEQARLLGWSESVVANLEGSVRAAEKAGNDVIRVQRAYLGWLLSNRDFVAQHDELLAAPERRFGAGGIPMPILAGSTGLPAAVDHAVSENALAIQRFCGHWRLQSLAGPYLPMPLPVLLPSPLHANSGGISSAPGMTTICVPDTYPVFGHGPFRDVAENAMQRSAAPPHLADWMGVVDPFNAARNSLDRYGRLFKVQHYLRVLYSRRAAALRRQKSHLRSALATFLEVSEDTVKRDWRKLDEQLGSDWLTRPSALSG